MSRVRNVHNSRGEKQCKNCQTYKPLEQFHKNSNAWDGRSSMCRVCKSAWVQADRADNPDKYRGRFYRSKYGLSFEEVEKLKAKGCALCGKKEDELHKMHIDHDHKTGTIRGVLCMMHNVGLGKFGDDPVQLRAAADYIEGVA